MEELNLNPSEGTEEVVIPQEVETDTTQNESSEVVDTQVDESPVQQDAKTNAMYADMRRKAQAEAKLETQKAIDQEYANMYGESHGIYTKADYDNAVAQQERDAQIQADAEKEGVSEDIARRLRELEDTNNSTKAEKEEYQRQLSLIKEHETLSKDETFSDYYNEHQEDIKASAENFKVDLTTAMLLSIKDNFKAIKEGTAKKAQQETINKIIKNGKTSAGSLASGGEQQANSIYNLSNADFKKMQSEVLNGTRKNMN